MGSGIVKSIKGFGEIPVANVMGGLGYYWKPAHRRPANVERMVEGLSRAVLERILAELEAKYAWAKKGGAK